MRTPASRYADRFDASLYADDEPVGVFVDPGDPDAVWVPERLFNRLVMTARGYALHLLPLLGGHDPVTLTRAQVDNLLDEIAFVADLLSGDPLVVQEATRLHQYLRHVFAKTPNAIITIEGG